MAAEAVHFEFREFSSIECQSGLDARLDKRIGVGC